PFKQAMVDIMYGEGISREGEILDIGAELDIIEKSGAWYSYKEERLGQGRENAKQFLLENPEAAVEIHQAIRDEYRLDEVPDKEAEEEDELQLELGTEIEE